MTTPVRELLARRCRRQGAACAGEGEPLYAELLERAAADVVAGGPCWAVLEPFAGEPDESAIALRFLGGVHRLVLAGEAPELAPFYPSAGGAGDPAAAWPAFQALTEARRDALRDLAGRPCQTNEVGRAAALLPAFLAVARATGLPLRLLEVGASAGLNLRFDHYFYGSWGDPSSPVRLTGMHVDPGPVTPRRLRVVERAGCDLDPIDAAGEEGALTLAAFTWPSQRQRLERLWRAIEVAREVPVEVWRADAVAWLRARLAPRPGTATVVYHSVFLQYLPAPRRAELASIVAAAARAAAADAPLAWVRMEPGPAAFEVRAALWPGGRDALLGTCGPHGAGFRWTGG